MNYQLPKQPKGALLKRRFCGLIFTVTKDDGFTLHVSSTDGSRKEIAYSCARNLYRCAKIIVGRLCWTRGDRSNNRAYRRLNS